MNPAVNACRFRLFAPLFVVLVGGSAKAADARSHSDGDARFLHHIDLYDSGDRKVTPESTEPYSSVKTCGRCHDYDAISHGWHFNAFSLDSVAGREGEPWIWTDARTGTQLPLSYRDWSHTYDPRTIGITAWEMTRHFGGRTPGGGMGANSEQDAKADAADEADAGQTVSSDSNQETKPSRWPFSGALEIDCMICHAVSGAYDFNARREQIANENFAWAATAGLRLGTIDGDVSRIKDGADPEEDATKEKLPKVTYDPSRFGQDGTVFMNLVREPESNACYQCHSNRTVSDSGIEDRWIHDQDVHLQSGLVCADCHRNGIDHHIVRGFEGEQNPSGQNVDTLSCSGCHLGTDDRGGEISRDVLSRPGRLGSPQPMHAGLPPIHFEKVSCTACHGGPVPREQALRLMTSLAHGLGEAGHRTGFELPAILGPVFTRHADGRIYPNRSMWPAFWGTVANGKVSPIPPEQVYDVTRRTLRVRKSFIDELLRPKINSSDLKAILGEDRAKVDPEAWTDAERAKVDAAQSEAGRAVFAEKVSAALEAIEKEWNVDQAVYVSSGIVYARGDETDPLKTIDLGDDKATNMISWPIAHNVRSAGWSLGAAGCTECHSENATIFASTVASIGPGPDRGAAVTMSTLQGIDPDQHLAWNELFSQRKFFKYIVAGSVALLLMILLVGIGAIASRIAGRIA